MGSGSDCRKYGEPAREMRPQTEQRLNTESISDRRWGLMAGAPCAAGVNYYQHACGALE
jgi:hypothetical protein